ncbi:dihydrodipicolinate reductase [Mycobacterium sp.]|uniref:NAD(P)H-dependent amine dehydrogenase family protein n=1 Tax=Mycobacterium sp. TaxID=1785 RepID=UPI0025F5571E|nr:dihydrodipicolinate reductase [Mycobacterium sp.]
MTDDAGSALRIVQWTTGNVAREAVKAVIGRSDLDLIGAYARSPDKSGIDIGRLCGLGTDIGVAATSNVDELLAMRPDCVIHTPLFLDVPELVEILRAGANVVTSAEFLTGRNLPDDDQSALADACREGNSTLFGSGINPGFMQMAAAVATGMSTDVRSASMTESVDVSQFIGDANFAAVGWGRPANDVGHADDVRRATAVFAEAVDLFARIMRVKLDDITCAVEFAHAIEDFVADGVVIPAGNVAGMEVKWSGYAGGREVLSVNQRWVATTALDSGWTVEHGYRLEIDGDPNVHVQFNMFPTVEDLADLTRERMRGIGLRATAAPLVNAIPAVCAAGPGIVTYAELPVLSSPLQLGRNQTAS